MLSILPSSGIIWVIVCWVKGGCGWRTLWWSRSGPVFQTAFPSRCSPAWANRKIFSRSFICTVYSSWTKIWTTLRRWEWHKSNVRAAQESVCCRCNHRVMWSSTNRILLTMFVLFFMFFVCIVFRWWMKRCLSLRKRVMWKCWYYLHVAGLCRLHAILRIPANTSPLNSAVIWLNLRSSIATVSSNSHCTDSELTMSCDV